MNALNTVTRKHKFDAGHRLIEYNGPCKHLHGHEYLAEITCSYKETDELGLGIDFSVIKTVMCQWIDSHFDHAFLVNPKDTFMLNFLKQEKNKYFITALGNPTAENISKELYFVGMKHLNSLTLGIKLQKIKLWETTNCYVETTSITQVERTILADKHGRENACEWSGCDL